MGRPTYLFPFTCGFTANTGGHNNMLRHSLMLLFVALPLLSVAADKQVVNIEVTGIT